jgi:hypothetical protein
MTDRARGLPSILYIACDLPDGVALSEWCAQRAKPRASFFKWLRARCVRPSYHPEDDQRA